MASSRGFLNIQSLNELTYENEKRGKHVTTRSSVIYTALRQREAIDEDLMMLRGLPRTPPGG